MALLGLSDRRGPILCIAGCFVSYPDTYSETPRLWVLLARARAQNLASGLSTLASFLAEDGTVTAKPASSRSRIHYHTYIGIPL